MRSNNEIRARTIRLIDAEGEQVGIVNFRDALSQAQEQTLDLVEISPHANPPVCKIMDLGKHRYDQNKRERESRKTQVHIKVKEVKIKPNIDPHDMETKVRHARDFLQKGFRVRLTCTFRGREMVHLDIGRETVRKFCHAVEEVAIVETPSNMMGRILSLTLMPSAKRKKVKPPSLRPLESSDSIEKGHLQLGTGAVDAKVVAKNEVEEN